MKQDGHSDVLSLLIAGFDLVFVCAFCWRAREANLWKSRVFRGILKSMKQVVLPTSLPFAGFDWNLTFCLRFWLGPWRWKIKGSKPQEISSFSSDP